MTSDGRTSGGSQPPRAREVDQVGNDLYFQETGHNLSGLFQQYWQQNGGLPIFGFPISEQIQEQLSDGNTYTVQYFERARFELHTENQPHYNVELGQFGRQILDGH